MSNTGLPTNVDPPESLAQSSSPVGEEEQPIGVRDGNVPALSVSEISGAVKRTLEDAFGRVRVRGEIGRVSRPASGHLYLSLKDDRAVIDGVVWRGSVSKLSITPDQGIEVIATGKLTTFPGQSKYQLVIEQMEMAGEGALLKLLEDRKKKLAAEGLFAEERKRPIPRLPDVIGVITSPSGAVIRDILHRLGERFPRHVLLWPVPVQGEGAAAAIASAITGMNRLGGEGSALPRPDVLIVARGGGSLEDLWAFNEEVVARAVATSDIPVISAVGHETDTTLIDFVSDLRAPTPSAAAEKAVPVRSELVARLAENGSRLIQGMTRSLGDHKRNLDGLARGLGDPALVMGPQQQRVDYLASRLESGTRTRLTAGQQRLARASASLRHPAERVARGQERLISLHGRLARSIDMTILAKREGVRSSSRLLDTLSFERVLERGFVVVQRPDGSPITRASGVAEGEAMRLRFADGTVNAYRAGSPSASTSEPQSASISKPKPKPVAKADPKPKSKPAQNQGDLF